MSKQLLVLGSALSLLLITIAGQASPVSADQTGPLLPVADGTYGQWTPKTGAAHYAMVDEPVCNGLTDYVSTATVNNRDSYRLDLSSIPNGATITSIALTPCAAKNGNGGKDSVVDVFYRLNGINGPDLGGYAVTGTTPVSLPTVVSSITQLKSATTQAEIGAVLSAGTKGARLGRMVAVIDYTPLGAPANLTAVPHQDATQSTVTLSWLDTATTETGFVVERSTDGTMFTAIATLPAGTTIHTDSLAQPGNYSYRVKAFNPAGSATSSPAQVTLFLLPPTDLQAFASGSAVLLSWVDYSNLETAFVIERKLMEASDFTFIAQVPQNQTYFYEEGLPIGNYVYRVAASTSTMTSPYSNEAFAAVFDSDAAARDLQREQDLNMILDGLYSYQADHGMMVPEITTTPTIIGTSGFVDLYPYLVPTYLNYIPYDPLFGTSANTMYTIFINGDRLTASAAAETRPDMISVTR